MNIKLNIDVTKDKGKNDLVQDRLAHSHITTSNYCP